MIDWLELYVPGTVHKVESFWPLKLRRSASGSSYRKVLNQSEDHLIRIYYEYDNENKELRDRRYYRVVFDTVGAFSAENIVSGVCSAFEIRKEDVLKLRTARVDFAADIPDVPIEWFKEHCRIRRKRSCSEFHPSRVDTSSGISGLQYGKGNELYRIYNLVMDRARRYQSLAFKYNYDAPEKVISRIERQCRNKAIPSSAQTLGDLLKNAGTMDPFSNLVLSPSAANIPDTEQWTPKRWIMNLGIQAAVHKYGEAAVRSRLNRKRNGPKFDQYFELVRAGAPGPTLDDIRIYYQGSTNCQLYPPVGPGGPAISAALRKGIFTEMALQDYTKAHIPNASNRKALGKSSVRLGKLVAAHLRKG